MSDRTVPFDDKEVCDNCGKVGAYDFMGDLLCPECASKCIEHEPSEEQIKEHKEKNQRILRELKAEEELEEKITNALYNHFPAVTRQLLSCEELTRIILALIKEALPKLAREAGYEKPQTLADLKAHARKRPDLILDD